MHRFQCAFKQTVIIIEFFRCESSCKQSFWTRLISHSFLLKANSFFFLFCDAVIFIMLRYETTDVSFCNRSTVCHWDVTFACLEDHWVLGRTVQFFWKCSRLAQPTCGVSNRTYGLVCSKMDRRTIVRELTKRRKRKKEKVQRLK